MGKGEEEQSSGGERHEAEGDVPGTRVGHSEQRLRSAWSKEEGWLEFQGCLQFLLTLLL